MTTTLTSEACKAKARTLCDDLLSMGVRIRHAQALDLVARLEGHANWSTLKALLARSCAQPSQVPEGSQPPAGATPRFHVVGTENLLPGHTLDDRVPCDSSGTTRKEALYLTLRVLGVHFVFVDPIVEHFQRLCGFSAPAKRLPIPASDARYADDMAFCNRQGQTRLQVLQQVLELVELPPPQSQEVVEEFRARGGLTPAWAR